MTHRSILTLGLSACLLAPALAARSDPDARIVKAIRQSYNFKVYLKSDAIQVTAKDGVVTLTGNVANSFHKSLAEETVSDTPEVKSVVNQLLVRTEEAGAPDAWLVTKVKLALGYHRNVDASATQVSAADGVVTLTGTVGSAAQKELTGDIVLNVDGVKDVKNELAVKLPGKRKSLAEKIDDASITAQVKAVLLGHRGTHMLSTRVKTDHGVVTLGGEARNAAEKELVQRLVSDVKGVRRIDNRMSVAK